MNPRRRRGLTRFCARRAHFFLPQGEALSAPHSLFPGKKERAAWRSKRKAPGGFKAECHRGRLDVPPGPPPCWVGAFPANPVNHPAPHFGYAARGCGGGRVPRSKAPPRLGENSEKPGAHRDNFGSEIPRPPSLVQRKEGAASSAGGGTAHGPSPGEKPWRVRGTSDCPGGFWRLLAGQKSRPRPRPWADIFRTLCGLISGQWPLTACRRNQ